MTAIRVVDDHKELDNVGSLTHDQLDTHVNTTPFVVPSGSLGEIPANARLLTAGTGVSLVDNGPGNELVINAGEEFVFEDNLTVSLPGGKTFGRYGSGETIPALGKTPAEVILMAIAEPIDPTVNLSGNNILTTAFNTTGDVTTSILGSYVINSAGASISSATLQFRTGNAGDWTNLTTSTASPLNYDHTFNVAPFFTQVLNYRYIVEDTQGALSTATLNLTPQAYASPTFSLSIATSSASGVSGETNTKREKGNVGSTITGTITRQRVNVPITGYSVQYSTNGSVWSDVPGLSNVVVSGNPSSVPIPSTSHNDASLKTYSALYYRIRVTDEYQTTNSSTTTINFLNVIFHGPASNSPTSSADVRSLGSKVFTDSSNPFNLNTGTVYNNFAVAMPSSLSITEVIDLDALNANITDNYVLNTFNVEDGGGTLISYDVYIMTNAIPYTSNHRHRVTRA
jgi:hypothetical protein